MAIIHEFILVSIEDDRSFDFTKIKRNNYGKILIENYNIVDIVELTDDLILYLSDFLKWLPCRNDLYSKKTYKLNYHGITYFCNEDCIVFGNFFKLLKNLFSFAPENLTLRGDFYYRENEIEKGEYEIISFKKNELLTKFKKLEDWGEYMKNNNNLHVIHIGI